IIGWLVVFTIRLFPFRPPNVEGVMATLMPFSKQYGPIAGFAFGFLSIALFDFALDALGVWTLITGASYGLLGVVAYFFLRKRASSRWNYFAFSFIGTLVYDALTGLSIGPLFFGQSFMEALVGQVPFTLWHLAGNCAFALILSPALERWVVGNEALEYRALMGRFGRAA
ncbi:MAG: hypothetical protein AAB834_00995, partial [Patescibacteria group bacterium]